MKASEKSNQKETLKEANRALAEYTNTKYINRYIGEFCHNGSISLSLDGNFELTELMDILDIAQHYKLVERKIV
jgi:hypothetical protein